MTLERVNGHYVWQGKPLVSVTTALGVLGKPALIQWAADQATDAAIEAARCILGDGEPSARGVLDALCEQRDQIRKTHIRTRDAGGARGTNLHEIADALARGETPDVPEAMAAHVAGLRKFLDDHAPETLWSERSVISAYGYAGTLDRLARLAAGDLRVLDFKTRDSRAKCKVWPEIRLQLAAYAKATHSVLDDADRTVEPMPDGIAGGAVVSVYPGGYVLDRVDDLDGRDFECFLRVLELYDWQQNGVHA